MITRRVYFGMVPPWVGETIAGVVEKAALNAVQSMRDETRDPFGAFGERAADAADLVVVEVTVTTRDAGEEDRMCARCKATPAASMSVYCDRCRADVRIETFADSAALFTASPDEVADKIQQRHAAAKAATPPDAPLPF